MNLSIAVVSVDSIFLKKNHAYVAKMLSRDRSFCDC